MQTFEYNASPLRVKFGPGTISDLPTELERSGIRAPFILTSKRQTRLADLVIGILRQSSIIVVGSFDNATMHTPLNITDEAMLTLKPSKADVIISIGGGSTIGLGKALSFRTGLQHICIPTTYAGSEMTSILGETHGGVKKTFSNAKILPSVVIYDVDLTMELPASVSATSGINAMAHAVEALYAPNTNPAIALMAAEGVKSLVKSMPLLVDKPDSQTARRDALYGAWLCGMCLGATSMGLHHKICHTLGGTFGLPHANTHAIILPHVLAYNAPAIPEALSKLSSAFPRSAGDAIDGLNLLLGKLGIDRSLQHLGLKEQDIDVAVRQICGIQYPNPRPVEEAKIRELLRRCWAGESAVADL